MLHILSSAALTFFLPSLPLLLHPSCFHFQMRRRSRPSTWTTLSPSYIHTSVLDDTHQVGAHGLGFWTDRSAVHEAAAQGRVLQLQQLIEGGAAVNIVAVDSITPLHEACIRGQAQCVRLLLDAGAQVEARNIDGSTPLCDACAAGSLECVKLLLEYGATVNPPLFTFSPLHEACMSGNSECVQLMIDRGAQMEAHDCHYGTPLHVACAREHFDCAKVLLNAGANVNAAKLHETALHHAAKIKNVDLIELLVEFGGNVYARDNLKRKPIHYTIVGSPPYLCLEFYENTPLSLQQLSRVAVRRAVGKRAGEVLTKLGLPSRIIRFLSYMPPQIFHIEPCIGKEGYA
ncbi:ankyrin repeat and SOCS box protein 13 isoform X1 [Takifugu rubripes]|uniref:Ankyrin repeat and SOCS box containing 13 n=1 Tax=Takifugu rubripes TaxID=31033 RepID=A0A674N4J3_TAKRU|nr:ankyrin repeat and SOCS box protein 13 isoform X1 [Takifugu rubripes]